MSDTTRPTLRDRLRAVLQDPDIDELDAALDAVLGVLADTGSPLSVAELTEMEEVARSFPAIDDMGQLRVRAALLAVFVRRLTGAYREVDAHRCVQADRIAEQERAEQQERIHNELMLAICEHIPESYDDDASLDKVILDWVEDQAKGTDRAIRDIRDEVDHRQKLIERIRATADQRIIALIDEARLDMPLPSGWPERVAELEAERDELTARLVAADEAFKDMAQVHGGIHRADTLTHVSRIMATLRGHQTPSRISYEQLKKQLWAEHDRLRAELDSARDALTEYGRDAYKTTGHLEDGIDADRRMAAAERDGLAAERDRLSARVAELEAFVRKPGDFDDYLRWCREVAREDADRIENERLADGGEL